MVDLDKQFAEMADTSTEDSAYDFVIDENLRVIAVPERGVVLGVEGDKDVNRVRFRMNRCYRDTDLSDFNIRINYRSANDKINYFPVTEKTVADDAIYFVWLVGADTVAAKGTVYFVARFFTAEEDGTITQEFNTTLGNARTLEGLAVAAQAEDKPVKDLLAQLEYDLKTYVAPFVQQVKTAKRDALDAIDTSKQGALDAVEKKGKDVLTTIPEDYTNLNERVGQLKEDKLDKPSNPVVGQFLRVKSISDTGEIVLESAIPAALKNPNALTIKIGSTTVTYDGSSAETVEIADGSEVSY